MLAHPVAVFAEEHVGVRGRTGRAGGPLAARPGRPRTRWCRPCSATGSATRCWRPRPGCAPGLAAGGAADGAGTRRRARRHRPARGGVVRWHGGGLLVNELAMRPHNSGHWTIEGARTSQFEQHLRAVLDLPLGDPRMAAPCVVMANVFGGTEPGRLRAVHARDGGGPGGEGAPVRQAGPAGPQDRACHRPRRRPGRPAGRGPSAPRPTSRRGTRRAHERGPVRAPWSGWSWAATPTGR